ncbi:MAG: ribonuclease P protein component [Flavobacteriales bacterium CG03_land_8_20_14_0_80_35_15]|nr:MAG: ribonuclease P protein component [Flavobacteriaceae bacterium CG1_02_35_72]PIV16534.1 MAG: ribonuclease P protein component [Flavobacteriales bacterium CG03_land_8_20_14_0_80_35_15]PIX06382.1 MAG: ribonuclease P protein component [Flavobacteriales bacterium CG_4_8_14_3_um_filter_35_10]PJA05695.1 MAG: ribonuclease P protein component [Flavobacteriales bacterium CG_4_10_14_0_2_um_filter_35_18]
MQNTYSKDEKLKHKKLIEPLFKEGKSVSSPPLRLVYLQINHQSDSFLQVGVSVAKRNFKLAVDRNKLKRRMREAYRLNKQLIYPQLNQKYILMFIYIDKELKPSKVIHLAMAQLLQKFAERIF